MQDPVQAAHFEGFNLMFGLVKMETSQEFIHKSSAAGFVLLSQSAH